MMVIWMSTTEMTLRKVADQAKKLRFDHPGKEIGIVFKRGKPEIVVER
jgi:hypothetical protein